MKKFVISLVSILMLTLVSAPLFTGCASDAYKLSYIESGSDSHDIITWNDVEMFYESEMIASEFYKDEKKPATKSVTLFGKEYLLDYLDSVLYSESKYDVDSYDYDKDGTTGGIRFQKDTDIISSVDFSSPNQKPLVEFDRDIKYGDEGYDEYVIEFARKHVKEIRDLDKYEPVVSESYVTFYKVVNGYKTDSHVIVFFRYLQKGMEGPSGIDRFYLRDIYDEDMKIFEKAKVDKKKLQAAIDEAKENIKYNDSMYDSVEIKTDIVLKSEKGELYAYVTFTPIAADRSSGEKQTQYPLEVMIKIA